MHSNSINCIHFDDVCFSGVLIGSHWMHVKGKKKDAVGKETLIL